MCRQWIYNGHSDAPVVSIDSKFYKHPGTNLRRRYYRNDSTDTWRAYPFREARAKGRRD
jgi:hypothetical protein